MIVRSITVEGWRCFGDPVSVGRFSEGLNVLHAPNAVGKSTLFEALVRGLLDSHRVSGRDVEALRPRGRALSPRVTVEFSHGGVEYRLSKGFLDRAGSDLLRLEGGGFARFAEGDAADEFVRDLISKSSPGRGLSKQAHWGVAQALWAPQGNLALSKLSGDLVADIRECLGVQISGTGEGPVERRIEELYLELYTRGGKLRTGKDAPALVKLRERLDRAKTELQTALERYRAFEDASRRVEDLRLRRTRLRKDVEEIASRLHGARLRADEYRDLLSVKGRRKESLTAAEVRYSEAKRRIEDIRGAGDELKKAEAALSALSGEMPALEKEIESRSRDAARARKQLEDARAGLRNVKEAREEAEAARRFREYREKSAELNRRLELVSRAGEDLRRTVADRARIIAPDAQTLKAVQRAVKERDEALVRLDAALITLEIVPEKAGRLEIVAGERTGEAELVPGSPLVLKGAPEVVVDIPGAGRIRAGGPPGSVDSVRTAVQRAGRKVKDLTEGFGTESIDELELLSEKAKRLDERIAECRTRLGALLSGDKAENLEIERSRALAGIEEILKERPSWKENPPDAESIRSAAEKMERAYTDEVGRCETAWEGSQAAFSTAEGRRTEAFVKIDALEKQKRSLLDRIADLERDGKTDEERLAELRRLEIAWGAARSSLDEIEERLKSFEDDPVKTVGRLEKQLEGADGDSRQALAAEKMAEGRLEELCGQGPYSALAAAEEEVARLEVEVAGEELRADAIKLLRDTFTSCRSELLAEVRGPVELAATHILRRIAGSRLGRLRVGDGFEPFELLQDQAGAPAPIESASGGEKEQIYLATRLALAEVLSKEERRMLVLDDVLTATDSARLSRIVGVLEEVAERMQVLIITCHPERYRGLDRADFFDLEALVRAGG